MSKQDPNIEPDVNQTDVSSSVTSSFAEASSEGPAKSQVRKYFANLDETSFGSEDFQNNWTALDENFSTKSILYSLYKTARTIRRLSPEDRSHMDNFLSGTKGLHQITWLLYPRLKECSATDLANLGWSLERIGIRPFQLFMGRLRNHMQAKIPEMNELDLVNALRGFSRLAIHPGYEFMNKWFKAFEENIPECDFSRLSYTTWMLANMAARPPASFMEKCAGRVDNHAFSPEDAHDLKMYLWSMTVLSVTSRHDADREHIEKLIDRVVAMDDDLSHNSILKQAAGYFGIEGDFSTIRREKSSHWEKGLKTQFAKVSGFELLHSEQVPLLDHTPDIIGTYNDRKIIIEADGKFHFLDMLDGDNMMFNGSTCLQSALLRKGEPDAVILRLNYMDCTKVSRWRGDIEHERIIRNLAKLEPGIYKSKTSKRCHIDFIPFFRHGRDMK